MTFFLSGILCGVFSSILIIGNDIDSVLLQYYSEGLLRLSFMILELSDMLDAPDSAALLNLSNCCINLHKVYVFFSYIKTSPS